MDIQLLRTFLEVHRTRHFAQAADALFLTQAAVSTRIAQLESLVGAQLFLRQRNNIALTPAGERLLAHAERVMNAWNHLLLQAAGAASGRRVLAIGCLPSISELFVEQWLADLSRALPELLLQVQTLGSEDLIARVRSRSLDVGLLYEPVKAPQFTSVKLTQMQLALVTSRAITDFATARYVQLDWGAAFEAQLPELMGFQPEVVCRVDSPRIARQLLLELGDAALLPLRLVTADLEAGRLKRSSAHSAISRDVYLLKHESAQTNDDTAALEAALLLLATR